VGFASVWNFVSCPAIRGHLYRLLLLGTHARNQSLAPERLIWTEGGLHAANSAATLALTYTLLGISLGVRTLADQELNTDTVQKVIGGLTEHFSVAFMTTVLGLPTAAGLRALISITDVKLQADSITRNHHPVYPKGEQT